VFITVLQCLLQCCFITGETASELIADCLSVFYVSSNLFHIATATVCI